MKDFDKQWQGGHCKHVASSTATASGPSYGRDSAQALSWKVSFHLPNNDKYDLFMSVNVNVYTK